MTSTQLQALPGGQRSIHSCIAHTEAGSICGRPATILDHQRGGMVCGVHAPSVPRYRYEVARSYLAKAEECLQQADLAARKEPPTSEHDGMQRVKIMSLALSVHRLRCELEGGGQ